MAKKKKILYPVLFMVSLTAFFTFLLAYVNFSTEGIIAEQNQARIQNSLEYVFNIDSKSSSSEDIKLKSFNKKNYYVYEKNNEILGYAFLFSGKGLWGTITGYISFNKDLSEILGIDFISHSETPGLGGRIEELWYKEQFRNIKIDSPPVFIEYTPAPNGNVDAITGATLTSKSVKNTLNREIVEILSFAKEANLYE